MQQYWGAKDIHLIVACSSQIATESSKDYKESIFYWWMEYVYVYALKERVSGRGKERQCKRYKMKGEFSQIRTVERWEFKYAWVAKYNGLKSREWKARERDEVRLEFLLSFFCYTSLKSQWDPVKRWEELDLKVKSVI